MRCVWGCGAGWGEMGERYLELKKSNSASNFGKFTQKMHYLPHICPKNTHKMQDNPHHIE